MGFDPRKGLGPSFVFSFGFQRIVDERACLKIRFLNQVEDLFLM
jgi:hypothetical protein